MREYREYGVDVERDKAAVLAASWRYRDRQNPEGRRKRTDRPELASLKHGTPEYMKAYKRLWNAENCPRLREKWLSYAAGNADKIKADRKALYQRNKDSLIKQFAETPILRRRAQYFNAKSRAKKAGREFSISFEDIRWNEFCPALGLRLDYGAKGGKRRDNSPSLDRIDNAKGYVPGNVVVVSHRANRIKTDSSLAELKGLVVYMENQGVSCG